MSEINPSVEPQEPQPPGVMLFWVNGQPIIQPVNGFDMRYFETLLFAALGAAAVQDLRERLGGHSGLVVASNAQGLR